MSALEWVGFALNLLGLAFFLATLVAMRRWWLAVAAAASLVREWELKAEGRDDSGALVLRYCATGLREALARGRVT